jgi:hypothetical protein
MNLEPIGLATVVAGLICSVLGYRAIAAALVVATLFGAAAALLVGSANIQPAHLLLPFAALLTLTRAREAGVALRAVFPFQPGFWLACFVAYGVISGFMLPRILAGMTLIVPLGSSEHAEGGIVPLGPTSGNLTQAIYLSGELVVFAMIVAICSTRAGFEAITWTLIGCAATNVFFALLDLGTYATGTQDLLNFMRNARYTLHHEEEVVGLKRIVGSWPEASAFAASTLAMLGFTGTMFLCGRHPRWNGPLALASLVLLVLSTSSTGLAAAPPLLVILYGTALKRCGLYGSGRYSSAAVLLSPPLILMAVLLLLLNQEAGAAVRDYIDLLILNKSTSDSGVERAAWNAIAQQNFLDSWGLGVGLGSVRTSSLPIALLANVGLPGTILFTFFAASSFGRRHGIPRTFPSDVRLAARNACLGLILAGLIASPSVDLGLFFYVLAGIAS